MEKFDRQQHWEKIYQTKNTEQVSWFQPNPITSLKFIKKTNLPKNAKIIDIGGGDCLFVDHLLEMGYLDITVLDISKAALDKAKKRLGKNCHSIKWIEADAASFKPEEKYDFWHDRAAFHFLTDENEIENYIFTMKNSINRGGMAVLGTFSDQGPTKCSGIEIKQYSEQSMTNLLQNNFERIECITVDHKTPANTMQNFTFCCFRQI